ncbi:urease accessory protein UreD [Solimonas terrae]|uniref:Urease accessory protein UreD n=2 Tax=Solimonas terrae TaxID=1396819 RepID=A0A6M2BLD8_9GAMM|nr:urease accessory protein UreD [Solimonas terrae]
MHGTRRQRVDGALRLAYRRDAQGSTRLSNLYQRAPCRALFPDTDAPEPTQAVLLTTSGGLTGGDRLRIEAEVGAGAQLTLTTQAAEKIYRALADEADTVIDVRLRVGTLAWAEWLAQETILFDRARLRRRLTIDIAADAHLLATESVVFGRRAMNEHCEHGLLRDVWRIRRDGRLAWADAQHLRGELRPLLSARFGFGGAAAGATLVCVGPRAASQLTMARRLLAEHQVEAAATVIDGILIVRLLAADALSLRAATVAITATLRAAVGDLPARLPRVWHC